MTGKCGRRSSNGQTRQKAPNPIDIHVGSRMRMRRMMLGMSQEKLADGLRCSVPASAEVREGREPNGCEPLAAGR